MKSSSVVKLVVAIVVLIVIGFLIFNKSAQSPTSVSNNDGVGTSTPQVTDMATTTNIINATSTPVTGTTATTTMTVKSYTLTEVAIHNTASSCWAAVNGGVYNLTTWIGKHPGGEKAILSICGKDGSSAFNNQHDGQADPAKALASFKIGLLVK
ncbi:MAG: cytochrome b5-like heme/steroid binding domain-containing protein [Candidatus Paceibacterota bacterium]|jgi:cytochrome b involved in lipid metabolism